MEQPAQFGPWQVQGSVTGCGRTCYLVQKDDSPLHVLKPARKDRQRVRNVAGQPIPVRGAEELEKEIMVLKRLTDHPHIITLVDYDLQAPIPYHVTQYCSGGTLKHANFNEWSLQELSHESTQERFQELFKAVGYAHSQGVLLGNDLEVFLTDKKDFVLADIEYGRIWDHHHLDTTEDIKTIFRLGDEVTHLIKMKRLEKQRQQDRQREAAEALTQAQPSAPRRLVSGIS